ncbi:MAG: bifunctional demethylmenaquinone methyltransferase/2-methoxy-6-polyprenyl-1,4-benzoquinol methylase UbiE [Bacteroidota bacterium]
MNTSNQLNKDKEHISEMFNDIAGSYDRMNHLLSFNIDKSWRKKLVASVKMCQPKRVLDVATGTGDVAFKILKEHTCHISAIDISAKMLEVAVQKAADYGVAENIDFVEAEAAKLPFDDDSFDCITVAFGIRNFENLEKGLTEMQRVLKPGGKLLILEFSKPKPPFSYLYALYSYTILPLAGLMFAKNAKAYVYLQRSAAIFPNRSALLDILRKCNYSSAKYTPLTFGMVCLYECFKENS